MLPELHVLHPSQPRLDRVTLWEMLDRSVTAHATAPTYCKK